MELWVRTADRRNLLKPTNICFGWNCSVCGVYDGNQVLGEYKTEERCFEIIDEIQKLLLSANPKEAFMIVDCRNEYDFLHIGSMVKFARENNFIAYDGKDGTNFQLIQPSVLVYEMPKE